MPQSYLIPILTLKDNGGGAVALAFARELAAQGSNVSIVASGYHGIDAAQREENKKLNFVISPYIGRSQVAAVLLFYLYSVFWSLRYRPFLIYTHMATGLIPNISGDCSLMIAQDLEFRFFRGIKRKIAKAVFFKVLPNSKLLVTSEKLGIFFRRGKIFDVVYSGDVGINRSKYGNEDSSTFELRPIDFLLIAKFGAHKRFDETLTLARHLAAAGYAVTVINQAKAQVTDDFDNLTIIASVSADDIVKLFQQTKVFVSLSKVEGYGLTPLEALSQGCAVVSTIVPSVEYLDTEMIRKISNQDFRHGRALEIAKNHLEYIKESLVKRKVRWRYEGPYMEDWAAEAVKIAIAHYE